MVVIGVMERGWGDSERECGGGYVEENSREKKRGESCWGQVKAARIQGGD